MNDFSSFGNFVNRTLKFVSSQYGGVIPDGGDAPGPLSQSDDRDSEFISDVNAHIKGYTDAMEAVKLRLGLQTIMLISIRGNGYLQSSGLGKALMVENPTRCAQIVSRIVNLIYVLSALIYPFMPATSESILAQLNAPARVVPDVLSTDILAGHAIGEPKHLFKKIDDTMAETWRLQFRGSEPTHDPTSDPLKVTPGLSKKQAAAAKKAATKSGVISNGPKSPEVLTLESKVADQGLVVRSLKGQTPKTNELDVQIKAAVDELKRLKVELEIIQK